MTQRGKDRGSWPDLPYPAWRETCTTLHLWTQIVGKIRLAQTPWLNHSWHVTLYVTARGLTTSASTQPPDTEPEKFPSASTTRRLPGGRGADPQVSTTHAMATARPACLHARASRKIGRFDADMETFPFFNARNRQDGARIAS
jgi:Family of unknown function (DUF5996)